MSMPPPILVVPDGQQQQDVGRIVISRKHSTASAVVLPDGRVEVRVTGDASHISQSIEDGQTKREAPIYIPTRHDSSTKTKKYSAKLESMLADFSGVPRLNIAIQIVGSRGDVQPFVRLGQILSQPPYSHRVRICTHPVFKEFVERHGLEFFSIGGDPATLMAYMVKNPGLMPGMESWKAGEVGKRRADFAQILEGCWRSCIEPGNGLSDENDAAESKADPDDAERLFIADAIIANPPSYGHIHCAEKLSIPLHMVFT